MGCQSVHAVTKVGVVQNAPEGAMAVIGNSGKLEAIDAAAHLREKAEHGFWAAGWPGRSPLGVQRLPIPTSPPPAGPRPPRALPLMSMCTRERSI